MATISENLQTLNEARLAIKTAIENKGQDLTDVPFTQYAEKINNINVGNIEKEYYKGVKEIVDCAKTAQNFFNGSQLEDFSDYIRYDTFENATIMNAVFMSSKIINVPSMDLSKATNAQNMCNNAINLKEVGELITPKLTNTTQMFNSCPSLETILGLDLRSVTGTLYMLTGCKNLKDCYIKNIKTNLQVGSGTSMGTLLTLESLLYMISELRDTGSLLTFTIGSSNLSKLANVYVRTIQITDEMRVNDDLIDEKLPFEVCESTDEGAMLITDYVALKNWSIA